MNVPVNELLKLIDLERLEVNLFRGIGTGGETSTRIFGGHVIAQALASAYGTVDDRLCHSLHAYFIRPGDPSIPVIYEVDKARDGGSFTTRRVIAIQHGKQIFNMSASFQIDEKGWEHQHKMPDVDTPDVLQDRAYLRKNILKNIPKRFQNDFIKPRPIEIREVRPRDILNPEPTSDINHLWFRMPGAEGLSLIKQQCLLAYASDINLLSSSLRPHGLTWFKGGIMTASLDHAMWFHNPTKFNDWHLYTMDSPFTGGARGFSRGTIFDEDGLLVASVAQEGLVRPMKIKDNT